MTASKRVEASDRIAIVGMAGRYPGARNLAELWRNLERGVESLTSFTDEELLASGVEPRLLADPRYVKLGAFLEDVEWFDAEFFGFTPREAEVKSPQQRLFLECAHEALEDAGYDSRRYGGRIGLYGGVNLSSYLWLNLLPNRSLVDALGEAAIQIANDPDYLTTSISYKLDLRGPSFDLQTACSTSLVAVHLAAQALRCGECEMALAGGVTVRLPVAPGVGLKEGYLYNEGGIWSADGHTRSFDARASGTVFGSGAGVVVLKRLSDAEADGDFVHAVILGSAINNDGSAKVGFTAPTVDGQARVVIDALAAAGVSPDTIGYVEAHGTGTALGDPIEVAGLTQAFREHTARRGYCAIGSVKSNLGHLSAAAGVAGLTKAVLALRHRLIPATINFDSPNPKIDFERSPFRVASQPTAWEAGATPRRAGVSSFGIGGTNAHVVLEEAPPGEPSGPSRPWLVLPLAARTPTALETMTEELGRHLETNPELELADAAYTLQVGRGELGWRRALVCHNRDDALETLLTRDPRHLVTSEEEARELSLAFMFPGQGSQHVGMAVELSETEPVFRAELDRCCQVLDPLLGLDLRALLAAAGESGADAAQRLRQTRITQPALFAVEYALARLWMAWGVRPQAMIGHSVGEYVAATLAGVFSLEAALDLVAARGRLVQELPAGVMLAVPLSEAELRPLLGPALALGAVNGPRLCVASGPEEEIDALERHLAEAGMHGRRLHTSHAFHSPMVEPALGAFRELVAKAGPGRPQLPFVSNLTGTWITAEEAQDPAYWTRHLRETVRFGDGVAELLSAPGRALLEVGPGQALTALAKQQPTAAGRPILASMRLAQDGSSEQGFLLTALARLWVAGVRVDWGRYSAGERRRRVPLPTYPFERRRHWVDQEPGAGWERRPAGAPSGGRLGLEDWFHLPVWRESAPLLLGAARLPAEASTWLLFLDELGIAAEIGQRLAGLGGRALSVRAGDGFGRLAAGSFTIDAGRAEDYDRLLEALLEEGPLPATIVHAFGLTGSPPPEEKSEEVQKLGFQSLMGLVQALGRAEVSSPLRLRVLADGLFSVTGAERLAPLKATLLGPCRVVPKEHPNLACQVIDLELGGPGETAGAAVSTDQLLAELLAEPPAVQVAHRGRRRWLPGFEPVRLDPELGPLAALREGGSYLVTGGLGGVGGVLAEHLARRLRARLVLTGRAALPPREEWDSWLSSHSPGDRVGTQIRKVRKLEELGAEVLALSADATDADRMREVLAEADARFGGIHGVIHAAGVAGGGLIALKDPEVAAAVLAPKVKGTLVLRSLLEGRQLDFFVLCSSLTSILGGYGQVDYCAANAFLDAFATAEARDGEPVVSVGWDAWEEVGMAADIAAPSAFRDLQQGLRREPTGHPLVESRLLGEDATETVFVSRLSPREHWVLDEHRINGRAVLPGTAYLEMARAAFVAATGGAGAVEIRDTVFLSPLGMPDDEVREVRTVVRADGAESEFKILSASPDDGLVEHARGRLRWLPETPAPVHDLEAIRARCQPRGRGAGSESSAGLVTGGPRWETVRAVWDGEGEALAVLELPEDFRADVEHFVLHPSLLDGATAFGLAGTERHGHFLPMGYQRLVVRRALPARFMSHLAFSERQSGSQDLVSCDIAIVDEAGLELAAIQGFLLRRVDERTFATVAPKAESRGGGGEAADRAGRAIMNFEGVDVFERVLGGRPGPQVIVCTRDLEAAIERSRSLDRAAVEERLQPAEPRAGGGRRTVANPYASPEGEVEEALATLWSQVLGIEQIGAEDDFFELGGNSLVAVQLVARIRDGFGIEFGIQNVLERPTVRRLAEEVEERLLARLESLSDEEVRAMLGQSSE